MIGDTRDEGACRAVSTAHTPASLDEEESAAMKTVVALPGEGIGFEVVEATCELLASTGLPLKILTPPQGEAALRSHGAPVPEETQRACREADGVLFGAAGGPATTAVITWLRWEMAAWAGVRPVKFYPGMRSPLSDPEGIDYVILRENSEGLYPGREGELADLTRVMPGLRDRSGRTLTDYGEGRFAVKVVTPAGAERIARFACRLARGRRARGKPGKVTCVTKSNVLHRSDGLFRETAERVVREAGDLEFEHFYVDDAARRLVRFPRSMDVVLCMNLYGDILSDLGAETVGGLGLAPSGCYGDGWAYFESVHGSAPDIAGRGIANPTATILSAALMLEHMGLATEAARLEAAVARVYRDGTGLTQDQGGSSTTREMAQVVLAAYRNT
jgi:3-isopropylmalate dehydrogenase